MGEVGIRELKNRLSEYVRRAKEGEVIHITDRGQTVAELRRPNPAGELGLRQPGLSDLAARGLLRPAGRPNEAALYPVQEPAGPLGLASRLLEAERADRRYEEATPGEGGEG